MTEQDRALLRVCAHTSVQCQIGKIALHPHTVKNTIGLSILLMVIEEPKTWGDDA